MTQNTFNDFEKVKQEIFSRDYKNLNTITETPYTELDADDYVVPEELFSNLEVVELPFDEDAMAQAAKDFEKEKPKAVKVRQRWTTAQCAELKTYYKQGLTIEQLAGFFNRSEENIEEQLKKLGML